MCGTTEARSHLGWRCSPAWTPATRLLWDTEDLRGGAAYRQGLQLGARGGSQSVRGGGTQGSLSSGVPVCGLKASAFLVARTRAPLSPSLSFPTQKVVRRDNMNSPCES